MRTEPFLYTLGHSTLPIDDFIQILKAYRIGVVVDIRTIPHSRYNPQFGKDALSASLKKNGIHYTHLKELGGLRKPSKDSPNDGWRNSSFRGYADYMQTKAFANGLEKLIAIAEKETTVILCAEAVPCRCHRSLVSDALLARHYPVEDIFDQTHSKAHVLNPMARLQDFHVTYPKSA